MCANTSDGTPNPVSVACIFPRGRHTWIFFHSQISTWRFTEGNTNNCNSEPGRVTNILSILCDGGRLFLNVTVTPSVCPRLVCVTALQQDCKGVIAASHTGTHTHMQALTIRLWHLGCWKVLRRRVHSDLVSFDMYESEFKQDDPHFDSFPFWYQDMFQRPS